MGSRAVSERHADSERARRRHGVTTLCPECLATIPGMVRETAGGVVLEKHCPAHGWFETTVSSDWNSYQKLRETPREAAAPAARGHAVSRGCPDDCGLCPLHEQHTCLAILEITSRCNLPCALCLADSGPVGRDLPQSVIGSALSKLIRTEGAVTPLQLGGGEPTLHPELLEIVRLARTLGFAKIEIESNGLLLARNADLPKRLRDAGLCGVYLQMDGLREAIHARIRGAELLEQKLKAIEHCHRAGLEVVLAVTIVPGVNDDALWEMTRFAMARRLAGVNFQPAALSGRYPPALARARERFTSGHFLTAMERQSGGRVLAADLTPLACPDPRCGLLAYVLVRGDDVIPLRRFLTEEQLQAHTARLSDWGAVLRSLKAACVGGGCGSAKPAGAAAELERLLPDCDFFSIGFHGMMDAWSFDLERARRCCVHRLAPDGGRVPFCLYNIKYRPGESRRTHGARARPDGAGDPG